MASNPKQNISSILAVIDCDGDKEAFTNELLITIQKQAMADLLATLPAEKQASLGNDVSDDENGLRVFNTEFSEDQKIEAIKKASESVMKEYLEEVTPTLSDGQLKDLSALVSPN